MNGVIASWWEGLSWFAVKRIFAPSPNVIIMTVFNSSKKKNSVAFIFYVYLQL
jgi:hypothetical protein